MTNLDALLAAGQVLTANHTFVDRLIDGGLYYGPGLLAAAAGATFWHTCRRITHRLRDRANYVRYQVTATRLHRVADQADAFMARPNDKILAELHAMCDTTPNQVQEEGR
ncbi:hypothetical protein ACFYPA_06445 [Streptomyces sp. NPDC005775]|uniref:hypothetical protein n=1 Tax=Streptomyces sp. NPDC005775 TaxID=3364729 RepID=UPI0036AE6C9F